MALTVESLLAPVSEDQPAGEDLSYDNDRATLEQAFESSESSGPDDEAPAERDWRVILKLIDSQFARTKDVWLAVYLCRAGAASGSLDTVLTGAQVLAGLFERYWSTVHPQLEELGLRGRKAPCDSLANRRNFIGPLERVVLIAHPRFGAFTGIDVQRFAQEGTAAEGYGAFRAALEDLGPSSLDEALAKLEGIEDGLRRADKVFTTEAAGEDSPNYAVAYAALAGLKKGLAAFAPKPVADVEVEEAPSDAEPGTAPKAAGGAGVSLAGELNSREEVLKAIGLLADYYRRREPGHPMPILLERARRWVPLDFLTLVKDIAPDGLDQAEKLLKIRGGVLEDET